MSEIMSQNEIDELLKALSTGEVNVDEIKEEKMEKKVRKYDFKSPKKLAKDQLRTLQIIHENFSRTLNTFLSGYLRSFVQAEVLSVEELSYYEFGNSIVNPSVLSIVNFNPLSGQIIIDLSPSIAFTVIDRILGGSGKPFDEIRTFTEIETTIVKKLMRQILEIMIDPWENVIELEPKLDKIETNSQFVQIVSPNETVALITLSLKIGEIDGMLNVCIPHIVIEPILEKLSTKFWFSSVSKSVTDEDKKTLQKRVEKSKVNLSAQLGSTHITVRDFLELQIGDVIGLDKVAHEELEIEVGDKLKFFGVPGTVKNKMAIKITKIIKGVEEYYD
ncbi:flagellar motor switch protein FliM [Serpentinicella alkaliphila]|uniref:Flagellar motor switch protein FliM n=1 Tax=Serpentinicella alkaliphila TaxID=1734049 RepID=A0A4R2TQ12_9FIRM|nr:flagellar motor switch protein FliM [Serpentinicella alkaliphila]QUH26288.1 flagellar motor switch protein FliM [Serpentinicella alkaliphila]TCQ05868.1 flagellar motor switch protein FliM [Serpentinicella alkaliphila]